MEMPEKTLVFLNYGNKNGKNENYKQSLQL